ncbi:MAG TPA: class I SAM-dependent methyltransferase, partial [Acidimicrobiales bacterium]|nr:class I SAM-dependent methyltransferase [Acidimicrobiales bacterium]
MFDTIAPRYDLVNRVMTFGLDRLWRRRTVAALNLGPGAPVLDLACGTGDLCRDLDAAGYRAVGVDLSLGMLRHARTSAPLLQADATRLPLRDGSVEGAVSGFALRNFVALEPVFAELGRVVRPGGRVALLDVSTPSNPLLRSGHALYFGHVVPRIGAALSDA